MTVMIQLMCLFFFIKYSWQLRHQSCFASCKCRKLVEYGNVWCWPHVGRQYRTLFAYGSSMSGLHIGRHCCKCVEYRCIWSGHQYCTIVMKLRELPHSTNVSQDRGSWLFLLARAWDVILRLGRERARAKKTSSLHSVCLGSLNWNETGSDLLCQKMSCKLGYRLFLHTILCQCYLP